MVSRSLNWTLLRHLLLVLIPTLVIGSALTFYVAAYRVRDAFDFGLLDDARDIANATAIREGHLQLELPDIARYMLQTLNQDQVIYAVWDEQRNLIKGDDRLIAIAPTLSNNEEFKFSNSHLGKRSRRLVLLHSVRDGQSFYVAVAQTTGGMIHIQRSIFTGVFFFGALLTAVALIGVYVGVRRGLKPIAMLRREIASRSSSDLAPLHADTTPQELQPIIDNVNTLMAQLEHALSGHRHFIADAAHQLRTPLAALQAQIEAALQSPATEAHVALQQIAQTTQRASHLANQLLSLARLEHSGQATQHFETIEMQDLFSTVLPDIVVAAERNHIELEFDVQRCHIIGNRILLQEMLSNVLDNAIRYVPRNGHIRTYSQIDTNNIRICIIDDGPGVSEDQLSKLGTPFFRASTNNVVGCGLGLAIAREIVRLHNGNIYFSRATARGGLRVDIELPSTQASH